MSEEQVLNTVLGNLNFLRLLKEQSFTRYGFQGLSQILLAELSDASRIRIFTDRRGNVSGWRLFDPKQGILDEMSVHMVVSEE